MENSRDATIAKWLGNKDFRWKIGNGKSIMFWEDVWCGSRPLKVDFPRLFG